MMEVNMIQLSIAGGLGNQMFEYAYARALSEEFADPEIVINPYFNSYFRLYAIMIKAVPQYFDYQLDLFKLNSNVTKISPVKGCVNGFCEIVPGVLIRFGLYSPNTTSEKYKRMSQNGQFKMLDRACSYYEHSETCSSRKKKVLGWFQSEKYFSKIRPILWKEFQFKNPPSQKNQQMLDELASCNSVCVHIRRGDIMNAHHLYVTRPGEDYYKAGMQYIAERVKDPVFYIFSNNHDDIEWIRHNYDFKMPVKYVDLRNPGCDDMRLMYNCKHFVLSKSTFSWWGSYMSQNPDKIIVAPEMELGNDTWLKDENMLDFYRHDMIKIHAVPVDVSNL